VFQLFLSLPFLLFSNPVSVNIVIPAHAGIFDLSAISRW